MSFFIQVFILCTLSVQVFCGRDSNKNQLSYKASRVVRAACTASQVPKKTNKLESVFCNGKKYFLVDEKLVGDKLQRYFTRTSVAAVEMSCCNKNLQKKSTQVHRRCLQEMFHSTGDSNKCPGCSRVIVQCVFAVSRANYLDASSRKRLCDCCKEPLGWKSMIKNR